jgi:two-component system CheB/CheR fusion protein
MVLIEAGEAVGRSNNIIVFATDVDREALEVARSGIYAESLLADIEADRLQRFFTREGDSYQVKKSLREKVIFAPQNLISDPPFSNLELISCRNLLIYIEPDSQERLLALFHFSLRDGGYLFLGSSETVGQGSRLFEAVSKKWRIYRRLEATATPSLDFPGSAQRRRGPPSFGRLAPRLPKRGYGSVAQKALIEQFAPAAVLVDREYHVLYYHGPIRDYIGPAPGDPSDDLLVLAAEGVRGNCARPCAWPQRKASGLKSVAPMCAEGSSGIRCGSPSPRCATRIRATVCCWWHSRTNTRPGRICRQRSTGIRARIRWSDNSRRS